VKDIRDELLRATEPQAALDLVLREDGGFQGSNGLGGGVAGGSQGGQHAGQRS
jgi:hypothetical protein